MTNNADTSEILIGKISCGSDSAVGELMELYRVRLKRMFSIRVADWMKTRVDPSDLVQETLAEASQKLQVFITERPVAFYPWLRTIGLQRLTKVREFHLAQKRDVLRETRGVDLSGESVQYLAERLRIRFPTPSAIVRQREDSSRLREVLASLPINDRELLILRYLEQLPVDECLSVLNISREAYKKRHFRAIKRLRDSLSESELR